MAVDMPRVGVVGLGAFGREHVRALLELGIRPVGLADLDEDRRSRAARLVPDAAVYSDGRELVDAGGLDAVTIATSAESHVDLAVRAAEQGIRVLVEKPMATGPADLVRMMASASRGLITPGHVLRFDMAHRALKSLVDSGLLGAIHAISASRDRERGHLAFGEPDPIFLTQIHDLDLARWIDGTGPKEAFATGPFVGGQCPVVFTHALSANGIAWSLRASYLLPPLAPPRDRLDVYGDADVAHLEVDASGTRLRTSSAGHVQEWPPSPTPGLAAEMAAFIASVRSEGAVEEVSVDDGADAILIAQAARDSLASGTPAMVAGLAEFVSYSRPSTTHPRSPE